MPPRSTKAPKSVMFLTCALADLILGQLLEHVALHALALLLEHGAARHHDVPAALVELDDLDLDRLAEQRVDVLHLAQRDLRAGQERLDPVEIDDHAALDLADQLALDQLALVGGCLDAVPDAHEVGALLGEHDEAVLVLHLLEEDLDLVADLDAAAVRRTPEREMTPSDLKPTSTGPRSRRSGAPCRARSRLRRATQRLLVLPNISARIAAAPPSSSSSWNRKLGGGGCLARAGGSVAGLRVVSVVSNMRMRFPPSNFIEDGVRPGPRPPRMKPILAARCCSDRDLAHLVAHAHLVGILLAGERRGGKAGADLDALDGVDAHERGGEIAVELAIDRRAEARRARLRPPPR